MVTNDNRVEDLYPNDPSKLQGDFVPQGAFPEKLIPNRYWKRADAGPKLFPWRLRHFHSRLMPPRSAAKDACGIVALRGDAFLMDDQIALLRQQVSATEFLLKSLKTQLREAEERAASSGEGTDGSSVDPSLEANRHGPAQLGSNVDGNQPSSGHHSHQIQYEVPGYIQAAVDEDDYETNEQHDTPEDDLTDSSAAIELPSIELGTLYPTLERVKSAVFAHAISQGWTAGVYKRDRSRLLLRCRTSEDCPFHLRAEQYPDGAKICSPKTEHSCNFQPDQSHIPRSHASSLKFLRGQLPSIMNIDANTTSKEISDAIFQRFGTRVSVKQCQHLKVGPKRKRAPSVGTCGRCGGVGHNRVTCGRNEEPSQTPPD